MSPKTSLSANHTELSWKGKSAPPSPTSDSFMWATGGMNLTSVDQCKVMNAADYTSSAGTVTGTLDVVNSSMAVIGSLPNGLAALGVMDGIPGGTSHWDGIAFLESCHANCSDEYAPVASHLPHCLVDVKAFLSATQIRFILSLLDDGTRGELGWLLFDIG